MIEMKHTSGPWVVEDDKILLYVGPMDKVTGRVEAIVCSFPSKESRRSNAQLISAAPELLDTLKECLNWANEERRYCDDCDLSMWISRCSTIEEAIAKAEGQ